MQKISLCITTYNRNAYLFKSFEQVINDDRIGEVVIVDDCSELGLYQHIAERCKYNPKIKLFRNETNLGVYENKKVSVSKAENEYCIVFDSDNIIGVDYLDAIYSKEWNCKTLFAPSFAKPVFDYRAFAGITFRKDNVAQYCGKHFFNAMLNTMNYFVHRDSFLSVWHPKPHINGADSIYMNYLWLLAGNEIHCMGGLSYFHRTGQYEGNENGSNYIRQANVSFPLDVEHQISLMR